MATRNRYREISRQQVDRSRRPTAEDHICATVRSRKRQGRWGTEQIMHRDAPRRAHGLAVRNHSRVGLKLFA